MMLRVLVSIGAAQALVMVFGLLRAKVLSTLLGPAGFGVISTIDQIVLTIVSLSALSLPFTAMKFMARRHSEGHAAFQRTFASFSRALMALAIAAVLVSGAILWWRPGVFGDDLVPYRGYLALAVFGVPAFILNILFVNTLAAGKAAQESATLSLVFTAATMICAVTGALAAGIVGLYTGTVIAGLVMTVASLAYLRRRLNVRLATHAGALVSELKANPEIVSYSAILYVALSAYAVAQLAARYVVFTSLGAVDAGLLQAQISIATTIGAVVAPMNNLYLTPLVNRQATTAEKGAAANEFVSKIALLILLGAIPFVLFPRVAVNLLFSTQFSAAASMLFIFVLWQCLYQIVNVYLQLLIGLDDVAFFALTTCASYVCAGLLFVLLVPRMGAAGTGVGLVVAMAVAGVAATARLAMKFDVTIPGRIWGRAICALLAVAVAGLFFDPGSELTLPGLGMRGLYGLGVVAFVLGGLSTTERAILIRPVRALVRL